MVCDEISARIQKSRLAFANMRHLWRRRDVRLSTKGRVYCAAVHFVLLYVCETLCPCGLVCDDISARIQKSRLAFANLRHLWRRRDIRLSTKGRVYCAAVRPVLLYGSETWPVGVEDIRRLLVFDHRCLRNIARISWDHRVSNTVVRKRVLGKDGKSIDEVVKFHQLRWLGHVLRMPHQRLPRRAMFSGIGVDWKKARGG
ncbi:unnamed protein product [Schistosoma margrebowiei]|uniref:Uncharacterized protein n=1 Tax=Schistosoma margrebowiei TaxID=48269 RepID=A0A3P7YI29_9TREM|nr:unnamed protein product [Schistosoma margrebowiei]